MPTLLQGQSASTGQDSRQGGARVDTAPRTPCGERLGYAPAGPQSQRSAGWRPAVAMSMLSPVLVVEGGQRGRGREPYCGRWEAGRMRGGRGHPQPPWLSGPEQAFSRLLPLQAGPCAASKPAARSGDAQVLRETGAVSAASPLGAAGGRVLFRSQGRDSVLEQGRQTPMAGSRSALPPAPSLQSPRLCSQPRSGCQPRVRVREPGGGDRHTPRE